MIYLGIITFVIGLVVGSAINALAFRFDDKKSFLKGRSMCVHCKHELSASDLVPVVSYLMLKGKCRYCGKSISWHYPAIELLTAASFTLFAVFSGFLDRTDLLSGWFLGGLALGLVYIACLVFVLLYDAQHQIIPNEVSYSLAVIGVLGSLLVFGMDVQNIALGALVGFGFFGLMYLLSHGKWIGMGDIKLGFGLGVMLGLPLIIFSLFFAYIIGALYAGFLLYTKKKEMQDKLAFGPFLALGGIATLVVGMSIVDWYVGLL